MTTGNKKSKLSNHDCRLRVMVLDDLAEVGELMLPRKQENLLMSMRHQSSFTAKQKEVIAALWKEYAGQP